MTWKQRGLDIQCDHLLGLRGKTEGAPAPIFWKEQRRTATQHSYLLGALQEHMYQQSTLKSTLNFLQRHPLHLTSGIPAKRTSGIIKTLVPWHCQVPETEASHPSPKQLQRQRWVQLHKDHSPGAAPGNPNHFHSWELRKMAAVLSTLFTYVLADRNSKHIPLGPFNHQRWRGPWGSNGGIKHGNTHPDLRHLTWTDGQLPHSFHGRWATLRVHIQCLPLFTSESLASSAPKRYTQLSPILLTLSIFQVVPSWFTRLGNPD